MVSGDSGDGTMGSKGYEFGVGDDKTDYEDCESGREGGLRRLWLVGRGNRRSRRPPLSLDQVLFPFPSPFSFSISICRETSRRRSLAPSK